MPDGYEPGVFKALQADLRDELWNQFITEYVTAQPSLDEAGVDEILGFRGYFRSPEEFQGIDEAANQVIGNLLSSFTLHLVTPIADLVVDSEALGQMAIKHCDCSRTYDPGCGSYLCLFHEVGCGPQNGESCTGRYNP